MDELQEIKERFYDDGYTISDDFSISKWIEDTHWLIEKIEEQHKEIERLKKTYKVTNDSWKQQQEEIERLKEEIKNLEKYYDGALIRSDFGITPKPSKVFNFDNKGK